jgi:hypothetical protein
MNKAKITIEVSKVHGKGVFAITNINIEEEILTIDDTHVVDDISILTKEDWEFNTDFIDNKVIFMQEPERFINHSGNPNCYVKTINNIRKVFSRRAISKSEEITLDYAISGDNEGTFDCNCGSERCRKRYVGNFFKLPIEFQKEYLPLLDNWFINKYSNNISRLVNSNW